NAASFAPAFSPVGSRLLFTSNFGDAAQNQFDIWGINVNGTALEQITHAPGFDGFPSFSSDGKALAFESDRATGADMGGPDVFVAAWNDHEPTPIAETAADRIMRDIDWLADPA